MSKAAAGQVHPAEREKEQPPQPARGPEQPAGEINGPPGPEPTRFGDWEKGGRCSDF